MLLAHKASFHIPRHTQVDSKRKGSDGKIQTNALSLILSFKTTFSPERNLKLKLFSISFLDPGQNTNIPTQKCYMTPYGSWI